MGYGGIIHSTPIVKNVREQLMSVIPQLEDARNIVGKICSNLIYCKEKICILKRY